MTYSLLQSCDGTIPMFLLYTISIVVIEMKEIKPRRKGSLIGRVLRILRGTNRILEEPLSVKEEIHVGISASNYYSYRKEIETAWLEAERKKAKALMEWQKRRFIC